MKMNAAKYDANPGSIVTAVLRSKPVDIIRATGKESAFYRMLGCKKEFSIQLLEKDSRAQYLYPFVSNALE
jgi:hypothetical protein